MAAAAAAAEAATAAAMTAAGEVRAMAFGVPKEGRRSTRGTNMTKPARGNI